MRVSVSAPAHLGAAAYDLTREQLSSLLADEPAYRVDQVWDGLYRRTLRPREMTELPAVLRSRLEDTLLRALTEVSRRSADRGTTVKWLFALHDQRLVETVLMAYDRRVTVCVSSQAGCAMGCGFCATGQGGFERNLSVAEIVEQVVVAAREARPRRLSHVVFMGMGEPLANYARVRAAIGRIDEDLGISPRRLCVSTVGIVPGIRRLAAEGLPVTLAVSLHAANDGLRDRLVPINRRYPLEQVVSACRTWVEETGRRLSFEWALIDSVNDRRLDMEELAGLARPLGAHVNLIPLNPTPGYGVPATPLARALECRDELVSLGVNATVRATRGVRIDAACGQLAASML